MVAHKVLQVILVVDVVVAIEIESCTLHVILTPNARLEYS